MTDAAGTPTATAPEHPSDVLSVSFEKLVRAVETQIYEWICPLTGEVRAEVMQPSTFDPTVPRRSPAGEIMLPFDRTTITGYVRDRQAAEAAPAPGVAIETPVQEAPPGGFPLQSPEQAQADAAVVEAARVAEVEQAQAAETVPPGGTVEVASAPAAAPPTVVPDQTPAAQPAAEVPAAAPAPPAAEPAPVVENATVPPVVPESAPAPVQEAPANGNPAPTEPTPGS